MAKFAGVIGYSKQEEETPGLVVEKIIERDAYGDVLKNSRRWSEGHEINDDLVISNRISIVADDFVMSNAYAIKYVVWMGTRWKITNIDIEAPRLILTLGGVYNGPEPDMGGSS